jgi:hypothetical protein
MGADRERPPARDVPPGRRAAEERRCPSPVCETWAVPDGDGWRLVVAERSGMVVRHEKLPRRLTEREALDALQWVAGGKD